MFLSIFIDHSRNANISEIIPHGINPFPQIIHIPEGGAMLFTTLCGGAGSGTGQRSDVLGLAHLKKTHPPSLSLPPPLPRCLHQLKRFLSHRCMRSQPQPILSQSISLTNCCMKARAYLTLNSDYSSKIVPRAPLTDVVRH